MKTIWTGVGLIFIASAIFYLSSQTYEQQSIIPLLNEYLPHGWIEEHFSNLQVSFAGGVFSVEEIGTSYFVEFLIRKLAHVVVFAVLTIALYLFLNNWLNKKLSVFGAFIGSAGYAILDEYHQHLTGGRSPKIEDVILDIGGSIVGLSLYLALSWFFKRIQIKKTTI
jgi:glycopeptide antibiotics resistance protein